MDAAIVEVLREIELADLIDRPVRLANSPIRRRMERQRLIRGEEWFTIEKGYSPALLDRRRWVLTDDGRLALSRLRTRPTAWGLTAHRPELARPPTVTTQAFDPSSLPDAKRDMLAWCCLLIMRASLYANQDPAAEAAILR